MRTTRTGTERIDKHLNISLPQSQYDLVVKAAEKAGFSLSMYIRMLIKNAKIE